MRHRFGCARRIATSALLISSLAPAHAVAYADVVPPATTTQSTVPRPQIDGPFSLAVCGMAFEFGAITGKWEIAVAICRIAQIIDPVDD